VLVLVLVLVLVQMQAQMQARVGVRVRVWMGVEVQVWVWRCVCVEMMTTMLAPWWMTVRTRRRSKRSQMAIWMVLEGCSAPACPR
jgi:hypothetical protein